LGNSVFVVYSEWVAGGLCVFAICKNRKAASMARSRVAKDKVKVGSRTRYMNAEAGNPYASEIRIVSVQMDVLYPRGLDEAKLNEFSGNGNEKELIH
jgi:hypothetical protein